MYIHLFGHDVTGYEPAVIIGADRLPALPTKFAFIINTDSKTMMVPLYETAEQIDLTDITQDVKLATYSVQDWDAYAKEHDRQIQHIHLVSADDLYLDWVNNYLNPATMAEYLFDTPVNVLRHWLRYLKKNFDMLNRKRS